ncbi:MAG: molybdenum cofactor guanylyltransferase [Candidatus Dormibacteraeota bacterium]|uniref:Probable molybdenum cofactor guanylyltransferase n=1 Tax=Candidatus Aeolococcus gillhamiae TaxID=3127015 RepID=A0A934JS17_9BACT|nr:molybdenum cofactor guanylyltransferase [Candidatus Dormibacteraeota bacterium]
MMRVGDVPAGAPPLAGLVLCGGRSRRMGSDKALLVVEGERLVDRAARRLGSVADPVLLACGARPLTVRGCRGITDAAGDCGPLAGIVAGLRASPHALTAVVAVDMPWLDTELLARIADTWCTDEDALVPLSPSGLEPLHAVYARSALPAMEEALRDGRLRLRAVLEHLRVRMVDVAAVFGNERASRFAVNLNTSDDLLTLREAPPASA